MAEPKPAPLPLPANLHPEARRRPRFHIVGGKWGFAAWCLMAFNVVLFGWLAWSKYGDTFRKVFARNDSDSYDSRRDFFESRFKEVEKADAKRRFGFFSMSIEPKVLKVYREGDDLVLDASDARGWKGAAEEAKELELFAAPGADLAALKVRFPPPRDSAKLASAAALLFERVLDGAPETLRPQGEIRFDDLK